MRNPPHSEEDAHRYSSHGQTRRDDRELHEGVAPYAKGGFHPDSSDVPSRRPPADVPHCTIGPVEQSVHAIEHRTRRHRDEKLHRSARRSSSADATAVSQPRRGLERNASQKPSSQQTQFLEVELQTARRENSTKDDEIKLLKRDLYNAQTEDNHYRRKDAHSQELLDTQRRELQGARTFLNTTDLYSGGDIIEMLNTLNSEIFQAVAIITDATEGARPGGGRYRCSDDASAIEMVLGDEMRMLLQGNGTEGENIAIIQAALQTSLNIASEHICRLWSINGLLDTSLNAVYAQIRAQQDQVLVSGTWRSLTRAQTKRLAYQDQGVLGHIVERMKVILVVARRWPCGDSESSRQITSMIFEKVSTILTLLARLDEAMNERVTSTDMMLCVPGLGTSFDAQNMEDADGGESSSGTVLFVTEMGLMRVDKDPAGRDKVAVLLKPKVFLQESFIKQETPKVRAEVQRRK
ncbi:hypothetical protein BDP27DRAFT_1421992 [Rhodocollybia butyracea]|uniref:Uncharacterized protein n=1 Tax=Rhodocollybia butyracea TaxID=206335 RepID=A0A9P5PS09_9AGAR|nr:hypothetical protein BDP27DRAFT_1421992 [Rhodocollybia butyracea]